MTDAATTYAKTRVVDLSNPLKDTRVTSGGDIRITGGAVVDIVGQLPMLTMTVDVSNHMVTIQGDLPPLAMVSYSGITVDATLPALTMTAQGAAHITGNLPALTGTVKMINKDWVVIDENLPALTGTFQVTPGQLLDISAIFPPLSMTAYGGGLMEGKLPGLTGTFVVNNGATMNIVATLPMLTAEAQITLGESLIIVGDLPALVHLENIAIVATLPMLTMEAVVSNLPASAGRLTYVMNTRHNGVTKYDSTGFPFVQIVRWRDRYYLLGSDGIYEWTGTDDNGSDIVAALALHRSDYGSESEQRMVDHWAHARNTDRLQLDSTVVDAAAVARAFTYQSALAAPATDVVQNIRLKPGRGPHGRDWDHKLSNVDGGNLEVDGWTITRERLTRHR